MATHPVRRIRGTGPLTPEEVAREQAVRREIYAELPSLRMTRYRDLARELIHARWINEGFGPAEEDVLLEEMEKIWAKLTVEERDVIGQGPPKSLTRTGLPERLNGCLEVDVLGSPSKAPRFGKVA